MIIREQTFALIDALKATCQTYGLGNDGNEYKIITQVFFYKFLNAKFAYEAKQIEPKLASAEKWEEVYASFELVDKYQNFVAKLFNKIQDNLEESSELASLRDFLLPMLMNGQVKIKP